MTAPTGPHAEPVPDADLVALVHGELPATAAQALRRRLAADPALRVRHRALADADAALGEALDTAHAPPAAAELPVRWLRPLLAAAALVVVAATLVLARAGRDEAVARNEFVELRVAPRGGASHPLFTEVALELRWRNRGDGTDWRHLRVGGYGFGDSLASLARSRHARETMGKVVPLVVSATLRAPDGTTVAARLRPAQDPPPVGTEELLQTVLLHEFEVQATGPRPYLGGRPGAGEWVEDFLWAYRHLPRDGAARWFPDQPGEWRIELRVECVPPPPDGRCATFAEPLVVTTAVVLTGEVSEWGDEHDGLRARLVVATGCADFDRTPFAIQLANRSGRPRRYNVTGHTIAKIPQPFHFTLFRGTGREKLWLEAQQRDDVAVISSGADLMAPHPVGQVRTLVVCPDYWRIGGAPIGRLPGDHRLFAVFHFEPSVWDANDTELWMGRIQTGGLTIGAPARR